RAGTKKLDVERDVDAQAPRAEGVAPEVRASDTEPLHLPQRVDEIQHHPRVRLVEVVGAEGRANVAVDLGSTEDAAHVQLVIEDPDSQRDVGLDIVLPGLRGSPDLQVRVRSVEDPRVEEGEGGGELDGRAIQAEDVSRLSRGKDGPGVRAPVDDPERL